MKPIKITLALALAASLLACANDEPAALLASAKQYMEKRDFNASVIQLKNVLQKAPEHPEARYLLGVALLEQGDAVAAQIELDKAVELGFSSDELQLALARTTLAKGEADKMLERFGSRTLSSPKAQAELRALMGMAHLARGRPDKAKAAFDDSLKLEASNVTANLGAARIAAVERNFADALSQVERALVTAPTRLDALLLKADLLAIQGQEKLAEQAYRAAIDAAPKQVAPRLTLVTHLLRQGALEKASAEAAAMEKAIPKVPATFYAKALVLVEEKKFPAAREAILQVLKAAPEHVPSLTLAGMASLQTGALLEAESYLRKAVFNAPQALGAKRLLAATHLRMGKTELALTEVEELLKASQHPSIVALAGEAHLANGDVAAAARHYEQAKALAPKNTAVQTRLALIRLAAGESDRAISELEAASADDANAYQADLALITNYLRRREADKALEAVQALEKKQPDNPLTHNLRGGALILKRDLAGARASFERALQLQPTYMPAVSNLAQLDMRQKKPEAARKRYEAVLKKEPNNEQALLGLAVVLRATGGDPRAVEKLLKQAVAANPASVTARINLVNFYLRGQELKAALAAAQEAQAALPSDPRIVQALGTTQIAAGETRQAIATFTRLGELLPKSPEAQIHLARAHLAAKQADEAIKALRAALALRPELATVQRDIAAVYVATGRHDEALREAKAVQADQPKQPLGQVLEAEVYVAQKKWDLAERTYRAALKKFDLPALAIRTHSVLEAAGKRPEAESLAQDWVKRHPKDATVLAYLGERDIAAKRYESAEARYQSALQRLPDNPLFLNNLAWVANELKRPNALEYAERAHELAPNNPSIMDTLGSILAATGETERGLELLGRAAELAPGAYQIRLNFAKTLLKAERKAAARKELEQLAKLDSRLPVQQEAAKLLEGL
jgi:putative PEP-CTERM system TPR-repeat lipoprotein